MIVLDRIKKKFWEHKALFSLIIILVAFATLFVYANSITGNILLSPTGGLWENFWNVFFPAKPAPQKETPVATYGNETPSFKKDTLLVKFKPGVSEGKKQEVYNRMGISEAKNVKGMRAIKVSSDDIESIQSVLANDPAVEFVEKDYYVQPLLMSNDPYAGSQYTVNIVRYPDAWNISTGSAEVIVAAPDTGVLSSHPDLKNVLLMGLAKNTVDGTANTEPGYSHGTATAGCLAADTNNMIGIASAPWYKKMIPLKISNAADGYAYYSDMAEAITYAADHGAKVVSLSYAGIGSSTIRSAASYLRQKGGLFFMAAGNTGIYESFQGGANWPETIGVAATTSSDTRASFSSYGEFVDISAPGVSVFTTSSSGDYGYWSGTSFASPNVASVAALLFSAYPTAKAADIEQALYAGAKDLGTPGYDVYFGYGRVDALGAMQAMHDTPPDTTPPSVSINYPANNSTIVTDITVKVGAVDLSGINKAELYINGALYDTAYTGANDVYSFYWDLDNYTNGPCTLTAKAYDNSGNSNTAMVYVTVKKDTTPPAIQITSPLNGANVSGNSLYVSTSASSANIAQVDFYVNGLFKASDNAAPFTYNLNIKSYKGKTITIKAVATAVNGLTAESSVVVYIVSVVGKR